jgi:hypothetical protein
MVGISEAETHQFIDAPGELFEVCGFPISLMTHIAHLAIVIVSGDEVYGLAQTNVIHRVCFQPIIPSFQSFSIPLRASP